MPNVMMGLGAYRFTLATAAYQSLVRYDEYRWVSQERIGRHPAMQYIGAGHTDIDLEGIVYPNFKSGLGQIDQMRAEAGAGIPLVLVSGSGRIFGLFCIISADEKQTIFFDDGSPRKQEFRVSLRSYGE